MAGRGSAQVNAVIRATNSACICAGTRVVRAEGACSLGYHCAEREQ